MNTLRIEDRLEQLCKAMERYRWNIIGLRLEEKELEKTRVRSTTTNFFTAGGMTFTCMEWVFWYTRNR